MCSSKGTYNTLKRSHQTIIEKKNTKKPTIKQYSDKIDVMGNNTFFFPAFQEQLFSVKKFSASMKKGVIERGEKNISIEV